MRRSHYHDDKIKHLMKHERGVKQGDSSRLFFGRLSGRQVKSLQPLESTEDKGQ